MAFSLVSMELSMTHKHYIVVMWLVIMKDV